MRKLFFTLFNSFNIFLISYFSLMIYLSLFKGLKNIGIYDPSGMQFLFIYLLFIVLAIESLLLVSVRYIGKFNIDNIYLYYPILIGAVLALPPTLVPGLSVTMQISGAILSIVAIGIISYFEIWKNKNFFHISADLLVIIILVLVILFLIAKL